MPESSVAFKVASSDFLDYCYLVDYGNFTEFSEDSSFESILSGKGSFDGIFNVTNADTYFFIVSRTDPVQRGSSTASFDLLFSYVLYNLTSVSPTRCSSSKKCLLTNITAEEMVIADNSAKKECEIQLRWPDTIGTGVVVLLIFLIGIPGIVAIVCCVWATVLCILNKCNNGYSPLK